MFFSQIKVGKGSFPFIKKLSLNIHSINQKMVLSMSHIQTLQEKL